MYEFDHMLNGKGSRQHLENAIREAQYERFASEVEAAQSKNNGIAHRLTVLLHTLTTRQSAPVPGSLVRKTSEMETAK